MSDVSARTKRLLAAGLLAVVVLVLVVLGMGAGGDGDDGPYRVRAIFDNAGFVVPGEDVKIAGVKVGAIESLDVTPDRKAAVVLRIDDAAFKPFRRDATCEVRLQSLIGEKFVSCQPTQPHGANAQVPPPLRKITRGDGEGEYLLPVTSTSSPVDVDLLNNIMRMPQRQRLAIIINELGVGLAGNGEELRAVIRRANPALQQFDRVLKILAGQNRVLANLARESDIALEPAARERESIARWIDKAGQTAVATAERGDDLEANFERFPAFLRQLTPTARRLNEFAVAGTPVMRDLRAAAPSVNRIFQQLGPFSEAALPTFRTLGDAADVSREALNRSRPLIADLSALGRKTKPLANDLAKGLRSLEDEHGIERLLKVILYTVGSTNGFDAVNHYLRSYLVVNATCLDYALSDQDACTARFPSAETASAAAAGSDPEQPVLAPDPVDVSSATLPDADEATGGASDGSASRGLLNYLLGNGESK